MATGVTSQHLLSRNFFTTYAHVPASSSATILTPNGSTFIWVDMRDYDWFAISACNNALSGNGITLLEIMGGTSSAGANPTVILASGVLSGTAVNNGGALEVNAQQIREVGAAAALVLRWVSLRLTVQNSSDTCSVAFLRSAIRQSSQLTPLTM